ncbi:MAG: UvrD-helicase domain-containing protein, partial [Gammaproteobacteria bacterium]|nr:UvrD-helicase domain-containing protein [Gammaproteobacteria bacterium]
MSQLPADHKERRLALDVEASFCVQAPAGSGKTELLTQRYLSLLSRCECPEEILAITFTRKAASEMRNRILEKMTQARHLSEPEITEMADHERLTIELAEKVISRDQALQWQLLENTTRLKILTIDSFNAQLTNQLPVISALGVTPGVVDDASLMYEEAVMELLGELENDNTLSRHLQKLLAHVNNQWHTLSGLLVNLLGKRDQWLTNIFYI